MLLIVSASAQEITWSDPQILFAMEDVSSHYPKIGATGDTCHFVWWSNFPGPHGYLLYCHTYNGGQTFSDTVNISGDVYSDQAPSMSVSENSIYISSSLRATSGLNVRAAIRHSHDAGMTWSDTTRFDSYIWATEVAASGDTAYMVWEDEEEINQITGTTDGGLSYSHNMPCGSDNEVQDGCGYNGVGHFVGDKPDPFFVDIIHQRFDFATGEIGPETVISPLDNSHSLHPSVATDEDGTIHVVWFDYLNSPFSSTGWIYYRRSYDGGTIWDDYQILSETAQGNSPDIWVSGDDVYLVYSYWDYEISGNRLRFRMSPDRGDTWSEIETFGDHGHFGSVPHVAAGNDNIYITYHMNSEISNYSIFFLKGELQTEIGDNPVSLLPGEFALSAYPNPFNAATTLSFYLSLSGEVCLKVYDITGREAASLVTGHWSLGNHEIVWNAGGMASGTYLVRLQQQSSGTLLHTQTRKVVLVK